MRRNGNGEIVLRPWTAGIVVTLIVGALSGTLWWGATYGKLTSNLTYVSAAHGALEQTFLRHAAWSARRDTVMMQQLYQLGVGQQIMAREMGIAMPDYQWSPPEPEPTMGGVLVPDDDAEDGGE